MAEEEAVEVAEAEAEGEAVAEAAAEEEEEVHPVGNLPLHLQHQAHLTTEED